MIKSTLQVLIILLASFFLKESKAIASSQFDTFAPDGSMYIGVDYYPEHWPEERWETDIKLMKEAGFNVVRLAEFSWIKLEPTEGTFEFD